METTVAAPVAKVQMLIRRPVEQVFEAFVNPAMSSRFWFSRGSARLDAGKEVRWDWEMYGVSTRLRVEALEPNQRILIEWNLDDKPSWVQWDFDSRDDDQTFVRVQNWGFSGEPEAIVAQALDSTAGFSLVLASLKAYLEHDIELDLVLDHNPDGLVGKWATRS